MLTETRVVVDDLIAPIFVRPGRDVQNEIPSMLGQFQFSPDTALETTKRLADKGIRAVLLFGVVDESDKDPTGSMGWDPTAPVQKLAKMLKSQLPDMLVITDTCLCEYTDHGHCGPLAQTARNETTVDNDAALKLLAKVAVSQAAAGAQFVAPSGMMDGQVAAIRSALDEAGFDQTGILAYSAKYASSLYAPFRDAAESPPKSGDRKTYQMDYRNAVKAVLEAQSDIDEGADIIMVKPAIPYLDIVANLRGKFDTPIAAFHVSGEYSQIKAAAAAGWLNEKAAVIELTTSIKRAGADIIITYFAEQLTEWL
jgi:porphobilinogen synthase